MLALLVCMTCYAMTLMFSECDGEISVDEEPRYEMNKGTCF